MMLTLCNSLRVTRRLGRPFGLDRRVDFCCLGNKGYDKVSLGCILQALSSVHRR